MREIGTLVAIIVPLSFVAFGGASSIYAPLQHQTVDVQHFLTSREFLDYFAIARVTPGPGSMLTTLIGWKVGGLFGALAATLALYAPAGLLTFFASKVWNRYRGTPWHTALEGGLSPIGAGLIFAGVLALTRIETADVLSWGVIGLVALVLTLRPRFHPLAMLGIGAVVFMALRLAGL